jgi:DNA-binding MarR family transcriptional regulator
MGRRQPTMSHHLTILRREGLVLTRKDTRKNRAVMVFINPERRAIIEALAA